jgi:hypothetical protein
VALGPDLQHRGVVIGGHLTAAPGTQRRDRDGQGIVRVVLVRVPGLQQPDPRSQRGLHVKDPLPGRHQLLGQEPAQPAGAPGRPGPLRPARSPPNQLLRLGGAGADPQLTQRFFRSAYRHRRMRPLVRVHADHYSCHQHAPAHRHQQSGTWRACLITDSLSLVPLSSHATARPGGLAPRYRARPLTRSAGGSGASPSDLTNATARPQRPQTQLGGSVHVLMAGLDPKADIGTGRRAACVDAPRARPRPPGSNPWAAKRSVQHTCLAGVARAFDSR